MFYPPTIGDDEVVNVVESSDDEVDEVGIFTLHYPVIPWNTSPFKGASAFPELFLYLCPAVA